MEYGVSTDLTSSGWKWFDGYSSTSGNLIDTKNWTSWPTQSFPLSYPIAAEDLIASDAIAGSVESTFEVVVPTLQAAGVVNGIIRTNGLTNTIVTVKAP
ncbi:hypothetical protein [Undibacterium squillarum]|uniref:hypothetical protein n=1 Tax=Undibacterium squillarum TaxID=1131567 RepID=UPI0035B4256D